MPSKRPLAGLAGIFLAAMMAGLNNRVVALALADVRGALGFGLDDASWLTTAYSAGELIAMPFSAWFAITLSVRRFESWMLGVCAALALVLPFIRDLPLLLTMRFMQGLTGGAMIPVLMMAALKFLPPSVRLHGLALYAMTATFAPNVSMWLTGYWTDAWFDWRLLYWQIVPLAGCAGLLIGWGMPREPIQTERFRQANWWGMACGAPALGLIAIALDQGVRLDWFYSPLVTVSLLAGLVLFAIYLLTEWYHAAPFVKLQILSRRNLGLGFTIFVLLLVALTASSLLPAFYLGNIQEYRPIQTSPVALVIALPQLLLGSAVALLLYQKWADARVVFAVGLGLIALACFSGMHLTSEWNREQFFVAQALQALGQPLAVVSMLFLATSVVQPHEGPFVSGTINMLRAFGSLAGAALVSQLLTVRSRFHLEMLLDHAALAGNSSFLSLPPSQLSSVIGPQSVVLSVADAFYASGLLALLLIPLVLSLTHVPAPQPSPPPTSALSG
jgi:DHA2 family multidrug resistance protein